jgi:hypothetical protein
MDLADRPHHIDVRIGPTLARPQHTPRPYRAAVKAAAQVALLVVAMVVMFQQGPGSVAQTLFFGGAALIYLMADFVLELPNAT